MTYKGLRKEFNDSLFQRILISKTKVEEGVYEKIHSLTHIEGLILGVTDLIQKLLNE
jgi:hypothetical protein